MADPEAPPGRPVKTLDIHTHLLNPAVKFERFFDRLAVRFFARRLGIEPARLRADPYGAYVQAMAEALRTSRQVERACLFPVDARFDTRGRQTHRDPTVCAFTEDVLAVAARHPDRFIPFLSVNPQRPGALELLEQYAQLGCRGAKFLQNYWRLDLNQEKFVPYYEKLRDLGLPLVIHLVLCIK